MRISTEPPKGYVPKRGIMFFSGPAGIPQVEAVCFTTGCNFLCPQCNNWFIAFNRRAEVLTPQEAASRVTKMKEAIQVERTMITGGEATLNKPWLIQYIMELRKLNPAPDARFLVDTNGSLLTHAYIDDLVDAGVTDISIDLKGLNLDVFMQITGLESENRAERYKETAWEAVNYLAHKYRGRIFLSVTIPYNKAFMSLKELRRIGIRLFKIDPDIHAGVVSYHGAFKRKDLPVPGYKEMKRAHSIMKDVGLRNLVAKTEEGFIQPSGMFFQTQGRINRH
jgi:pyruvate formate lyase activating enzyme